MKGGGTFDTPKLLHIVFQCQVQGYCEVKQIAVETRNTHRRTDRH